ncbi:uncharacterized protein LOC6584140 [Drosophila mojavensis]|uniref:Uncharacterized protein n=1 Tax=Drosophila mojavensis TaxID=7230 RepID=B4L3I9_DROMO|nr:uncharacterized protein LOC6584140 [Drosophila mojavensis]EDW07117.1 uncharacterized protein Dmoj_GI15559 [Drosophila mojavensis]
MRGVTICLLLLTAASCLIGSSGKQAATAGAELVNFEAVDLANLIDELDDDYVDVEESSFISSVHDALKVVLQTLRGVNCTIKEVAEILNATAKYVETIDACGVTLTKDVAAIVRNCKTIIAICNDIIHMQSKLCAIPDEPKSNALSPKKCSWQLLKAVVRLARTIRATRRQIARLPSDTSSCFVNATSEVKASYDSFAPNIHACFD